MPTKNSGFRAFSFFNYFEADAYIPLNIDRPAIEGEVPRFVYEADEIEAARINYEGFRYMTPAQLKKKARKDK